MSISNTLRVLALEIHRYESRYLEARAMRPELAPHATPDAAVSALRAGQTEGKFALVAALIAENQARPHRIWTSILLLGFAPLLVALRKDLGDPRNEEHDQRVVLAFLDAVTAVRPSAGLYAAASLRRLSAKALFPKKSIARDAGRSAAADMTAFDEEEHSPHDERALHEAELRIDVAWAAKRAARTATALSAERSRVRKLPRRSEVAA